MRLLRNLFAGATLFIFGLPGVFGMEGPERLFSQANEAYSREDFAGAIDLYRQCLHMAESAALHYNLANAYYELGDTGRAVLHYEKALAMEPANPDTAANLSFVREAAELPSPSYGLATRLGKKLPIHVWGWMAAIGFWVSLALLLLPRLYGGSRALPRLLLFAAILVTVASGIALRGYHKISNDGVILQNDTPLQVAPSPQSSEYAYLQAGEMVVIEKQYQAYLFIDNRNDKSGWVLAEEVGRIWE